MFRAAATAGKTTPVLLISHITQRLTQYSSPTGDAHVFYPAPGRAGDGAAAGFAAEPAEGAAEGTTGDDERLPQRQEGEDGAAGAAAAAQDAAGGGQRGEADSPSR